MSARARCVAGLLVGWLTLTGCSHGTPTSDHLNGCTAAPEAPSTVVVLANPARQPVVVYLRTSLSVEVPHGTKTVGLAGDSNVLGFQSSNAGPSGPAYFFYVADRLGTATLRVAGNSAVVDVRCHIKT